MNWPVELGRMMKRIVHIIISLSSPVVIAGLATLLVLNSSHATNLSIKIFLLREVEACRPSGYIAECKTWPANDVVKLYDSALVKSVSHVPPGEVIHLGDLLPVIRTYASFRCPLTAPCDEPQMREAVMMLFQWDAPQNGKVTFTRNAVDRLPARSVSGVLRGELYWVDHQRADLFFPAYGTTWELRAGENSWTFVAK